MGIRQRRFWGTRAETGLSALTRISSGLNIRPLSSEAEPLRSLRATGTVGTQGQLSWNHGEQGLHSTLQVLVHMAMEEPGSNVVGHHVCYRHHHGC